RLGLVAVGDVGVREFARLRGLAVDGELELTAAIGALGIIVERPIVARAVVADRCRTKLARYEWRDERAAALVPGRDKSHGQPSAAVFAAQIEAERSCR